MELTAFASQEERGKSVLKGGRNEGVGDLFLNTDDCTVCSKEWGRERRKIERNPLHGDTKCDRKSKTGSFRMLLIGTSMFRSITYILRVSQYVSFRHVHTAGQRKWSQLCVSIQV